MKITLTDSKAAEEEVSKWTDLLFQLLLKERFA